MRVIGPGCGSCLTRHLLTCCSLVWRPRASDRGENTAGSSVEWRCPYHQHKRVSGLKPLSLRMKQVCGFRSCLGAAAERPRLVTKIRRMPPRLSLGSLRRSFVTWLLAVAVTLSAQTQDARPPAMLRGRVDMLRSPAAIERRPGVSDL